MGLLKLRDFRQLLSYRASDMAYCVSEYDNRIIIEDELVSLAHLIIDRNTHSEKKFGVFRPLSQQECKKPNWS